VPSGSVKWSSPTGGAGFIQRDHGYNRVLIHILRFERADLDGLRQRPKVQFARSASSRASWRSAKPGADLAQRGGAADPGMKTGK
jgi:cold shock CspA family protein